MKAEEKFAKLYEQAKSASSKIERRNFIGKLFVELIDDSISKKIDWRLVNEYARKVKPLTDKNDLMMREVVCDLEYWDDYTRDHGNSSRTRQFARDIAVGIFYEELTSAMIYYVELMDGRPVRGVSYLAWEDNGKLRTRVTNSLAEILDPILQRSKNINQFVENLPSKIGELELFGEPEVGPWFRFDIDC